MASVIYKIRRILWQILGISQEHATLSMGAMYLKEDGATIIGHASYTNRATVYRWQNNGVDIGRYCSIADNATFIVDDGKHQFNIISTYPFSSNKISSNTGIIIGNDVWIGINATILYGVKIGDGAIVAAGAVVTNDVEPYTIVGGVPAKILKRRCSADEAKEMQKIAWWNWPDNTIEARLSDFRLSFTEFIEKYK